jgi:hypothetical protein
MSLPADYLTSQAINLYTSGSNTLQPTDSVGLSFFYQARGRGDTPESTDSLILDLYKPAQGVWASRVWHAKGNTSPNTNDTIFKEAIVWLTDTAFLHDNFKFRFRNKATTAGDFDHWHLDYIYIEKFRSLLTYNLYDDVALGYIPTPFLTNYSAMPLKQYLASDKALSNSVFIRNNRFNDTTVGQNVSYESQMFEEPLTTPTYTYSGGANPTLKAFKYKGWNDLLPHRKPAFTHTFTFPATDSVDYRIKHYIFRSGFPNDFIQANDTVTQYQCFRNYYAFDDGSAEGGYYILGSGGRILQQIKVNVGDTLRALRIYFDPVGNYNSTYKFRMNVWSDLGNGSPGLLIHVDSAATNIVKHYTVAPRPSTPEYVFQKPIYLSPGTYFIGFQQLVATGITVGFDKNINHSDRLWFDSGNGWTQSSIYGSAMIRAVFGPKIPPPVGIREFNSSKNNYFIAYPNPANNDLNIELKENVNGTYNIINSIGQTIKAGLLEGGTTSVHTSEFSNGVYFLTVTIKGQAPQCSKIIIQH